jgi:hypothetical protein
MRMIFRRHYPIILALLVFIGFQIFLKLNSSLSTSRGLVPDFPINDQPLVVADNNQINNAEPIEKILDNDKNDDKEDDKSKGMLIFILNKYSKMI